MIERRSAQADDLLELRGIGVTAAAVLACVLVASGCATAPEASATHTCGPTDKRFIKTASVNMTALGIWAAGYQSGEIPPEKVAEEAKNAARRLAHAEPSDPSLRQAQRYMNAMFEEYGEALELHAKGKRAGKRIHRAYGLANFAREVLVEAEPELGKRGCDVGPLL